MTNVMELIRGFDADIKKMRWLMQGRMFSEGIALARKYDGLFPKDRDLPYLHGRMCFHAEDFPAADALLAKLYAFDPHHIEGAAYYGATLARLGRRDEAMTVLKTAYADDPNSDVVLDFYIPLVLAQEGLPQAIAMLKAAYDKRSAYKKPETAIEQLRHKALSLFDIEVIRAADPGDFLKIEARPQESGAYSYRAIYERIEPLGSNCELGGVQRRRGAEPLSLFRWTSVTPDNLVRLLSCDLEGYERPEIYSLRGTMEQEYFLYEDLFETLSHTGANSGDMAPDDFLARVTRRQGFLKRKFLADAAEGQKIFTYKVDWMLDEAEIDAIEAQLRRLGVRKSLFVLKSPDRAQAGTTQIVSPTRMMGYLSAVQPNVRFDEWDKIALAADAHFVRGPARS